jgi:hypothetical protein
MRDIIGYEDYCITEDGQIWSKRTKKFLKLQNHNRGYALITLSVNAKRKPEVVHRFVARAFVDNPNKYNEINHKDGDKKNNHFTNLEWCSRSDNNTHKCRILGKGRGIGNGAHKLTEQEVLEIRSRRHEVQKRLGEEFGVDQSVISDIINRKIWKHI